MIEGGGKNAFLARLFSLLTLSAEFPVVALRMMVPEVRSATHGDRQARSAAANI